MPILTPPELPQYKLLDLIGYGGMGSVYIAYRLRDSQLLAIKFLDTEMAENQMILDQFIQEGEILASLDHPNIVKYADRGCAEGIYYLAMEYVDGISFDNFPKNASTSSTTTGIFAKDPSINDYLQIFAKCFSALSYVHKNGLIHKDIKPHNIILQGKTFEPKLIDFGIASYADSENDLDINPDRVFTVAYASPEQLTNKPSDHLSDLFSFGVVMYEKLTGQMPFKGKRAMEVFIEQTKWNFPPPSQLNPEIPQKLEDIILKLLSRNPELRYPTADMVHGELERLQDILKESQVGLSLTGIISDIRGLQTAKKKYKKRTLKEEEILLKKHRTELLEASQQLKIESAKVSPDLYKTTKLQELCNTLREDYKNLEKQTKMAIGFKSQPLVVDDFNKIYKLETFAFEKRGIPLTINLIEQKLVTTDGEDIIVGDINFSQQSKRVFSINKRDSFLTWNTSNWFFSAYEEKDFPVYLMMGDKRMPHMPKGFKGFFWPFEFLLAIQKLGWTGVSIIETFNGVDRSGQSIFAEQKETVLFSKSLFDKMEQILEQKGKKKNEEPKDLP
ncbi:MAG: serine/threonine protein kinase [Candidatus Riflebacteria bacterium]|nr:serine/threonine protein kinase [Candidatus Riflebacteria bacterium]